MTIASSADLDTELLIELFQTQVHHESLPDDIFDHLAGDVIYPGDNTPPDLPEAIYLRLDAQSDEARTVKVPMVKDLVQDPTLGSDGTQEGNEEDITTKFFQMHYTDLSHATTNRAFGIQARDKLPYRLFQMRTPLLGRYFKQYFGVMRRQALLEGISENLAEAPHFLDATLSRNWWIPNTSDNNQPGYDTSENVHVANLVQAMLSAGTGVAAMASVENILALEQYARNVAKIDTLMFAEGFDGYVLTLPSPQATWLKNPNQIGQLGELFISAQAMGQTARAMYPGLLGRIGNIVLVEDQRYPTLTLGGSGSAGSGSTGLSSITPQYRRMGDADDGSSDPRDFSATSRQVSFLLGSRAICEWMPEGFHWEWQYESYDKEFGSGLFCSVGIKRVEFDVGTGASSTTLQQRGSIVIPWAPARQYFVNSRGAV